MGREIVEQNDGALPIGKEVFEGKDLAAIAQGALREQPHLGWVPKWPHDSTKPRIIAGANRLLEAAPGLNPADQIIYGIPMKGGGRAMLCSTVRWDDLAVFAFFKEGQ